MSGAELLLPCRIVTSATGDRRTEHFVTSARASRSCPCVVLVVSGHVTVMYLHPVGDLSRDSHLTYSPAACVSGKTKCLSKLGDCVVKHVATSATGLSMVVS